jgi:cyclohexanecarboxyl-CoA dehydrogenase
MVSFAFTEEQEAFREALETYARKVLLPGYRDRAASADFPLEILADLGRLGVLGIGLPAEGGGSPARRPRSRGRATRRPPWSTRVSPARPARPA